MKNINTDPLDQNQKEEKAEDLLTTDAKQSEKIVSEVKADIKLFVDERGDPYARIKHNGHFENWPIGSRNKKFKIWIARRGRQILGAAPTEAAVKEAVTTLNGEAIFGKTGEYELYNRVGVELTPGGEKYWYDLANPVWSAIEITAQGWKESKSPPIIFRRYQQQLPQIVPLKDGNDLRLIDKYLCLENENYKILIYVFLVTSLIANMSHACFILYGPQGSTKTTLFKILRFLIDPSRLSVLNMGSALQNIIQKLEQNWFCPFDNLSGLKKDISDILCQAITGAGFCDRVLYTDDEPFIRNIRRVIGLNGINVSAVQPDLLERCILIELKSISKKERKSEAEIWRDFETDKTRIFGGMLDTLVRAITIRSKLIVHSKLRMADFAIWGEAVARAMGFPDDYFLRIYEQNMDEINIQGIHSDFVAAAVRELVGIELEKRKRDGLPIDNDPIVIWSGQPSRFIIKLEDIAICNRIITSGRDKYWPGQANAMSRRLNLIKPTLEPEGIIVSVGERTAAGRWITVTYRKPQIVEHGVHKEPSDKNDYKKEESAQSGGIISDGSVSVDTSENIDMSSPIPPWQRGGNNRQDSRHDDNDKEINVEEISF